MKYTEDMREDAGPGWAGIVDKLVEGLKALGWDGEVFQIKEKYGGLRFYVGASTDPMDDLIFAAEMESYQVCQTCGEAGKLRDDGWCRTLCDKCEEQ